MGLVHTQDAFLTDVCKLIHRAHKGGWVVTAGEIYRTREQQQVYFTTGRSKTMDSMHLQRLAIDLNLFRTAEDDRLVVVTDRDAIKPLGDYWTSLHRDNQWGGNWTFVDSGHFERRPGSGKVT